MNRVASISNVFNWAQTKGSYASESVTAFELCLAVAAGVTDNPAKQHALARALNSSVILLPADLQLGGAEKEAIARQVENLFPQDAEARLTREGMRKYEQLSRVLGLRRVNV